jgi:hypothetical protein
MLGKILGRLVAAPLRIVNVPVHLGAKVLDEMGAHFARDENTLDRLAETVEKAATKIVDGEDE